MRKAQSFFAWLLLAALLLLTLGACGEQTADETGGPPVSLPAQGEQTEDETEEPPVTLPFQKEEPETYPITEEDKNGDGLHDGDAAVLQKVIDQFPEIYVQDGDPQYRMTVEHMASWSVLEEGDTAPKRAVHINWWDEQLWGHVSLAGLDALEEVHMAGRNYLTSLDVSGCTSLTKVSVTHNYLLESVTLTGCAALEVLVVDFNSLRELDLTGLTALRYVDAACNLLTSLDVSMCPELETLIIGRNFLTELNVLSNTKLKELSCGANNLTSLDVTGLQLKKLNVSWNMLLGTEFYEADEQYAMVGTNVIGLSQPVEWATQADVLDNDYPFVYVHQNNRPRTEEDADWMQDEYLDAYRV